MKKTISIIVGSALIGGVGYGAYQQSRFQSQVQTAVASMVTEIDGYRIEDQRLSAALSEHGGGLFSSEGLVTITAGPADKLSVLEISYRVDHDALTLVNGARFEARAHNTLLGGSSVKTITGLLFGGRAVEMWGQILPGAVTGTTRVPEISLAENEVVITSAALVGDWTLQLTEQGVSADNYRASWSLPEFSFSENRTVPSRLSFRNLSGTVSRTVDAGGDRGEMNMTLDMLRFSGAQGAAQAGGIVLSSATEVAEMAMSTMRFSINTAKVQGMDVGPAALDLRVDRIDGDAVRQFVSLLERAQQEQWDEARVSREFEKLVVLAGDKLLQNDPILTLNDLNLAISGKGDARISGSARLDHNKLTSTAIQDLITGDPVMERRFKQELVQALSASLTMETSGEVQMIVAQLLGGVNPMLGQAASDGQLDFSFDAGTVTLDGNPI